MKIYQLAGVGGKILNNVGFGIEGDGISHRLTQYCWAAAEDAELFLDWSVVAHVSELSFVVNDPQSLDDVFQRRLSGSNGILLVSESKQAMIKGLRKVYDVKKSERGYVAQAQGSLGIAAAELGTMKGGSTSTVASALKTVAHNIKTRATRSGKVKSLSGAIQEVKGNQMRSAMGYAVYIAPSQYLPHLEIGGMCFRVIDSTLNMGQIATYLQRPGDNQNLRLGHLSFN
jgi:hypothetical protein